MIELPEASVVPVVRTDLSDTAAWQAVRQTLTAPSALSEYEAALAFFDRPDWAELQPEHLEEAIPRMFPTGYEQPFLVVVDRAALASPEHAVLIVDLSEDEPAPSFRALPREVADIEANLSLANLDFRDFQEAAAADGVFRGFQ